MAALYGQKEIIAITSKPDFEIITTVAYSAGFASPANHETNPSPINYCFALNYALDRLLAAAIDFSWPQVVSDLSQPDKLSSLAAEIEAHMLSEHPTDKADAMKAFIARVAYNNKGNLMIILGPRPKYPNAQYWIHSLHSLPSTISTADTLPAVPVHLDYGSVTTSLFTKHKTTFRDEYTAARDRVGLTPTTSFREGEVLLQNHRGEITGGGFTTAYFLRHGTYITPSVDSGAKAGVSRRWTLEHAGVEEGTILAEHVMDGEMIWLSSATGGFVKGVVRRGET